MEQMDVIEMDPIIEELYCLSDLPVAQEQEDEQVFTLVIETDNYRIEIEIG